MSLSFAIALLCVGVFVALVARFFFPDRDSLSPAETVLLGLVGSFLAGLIAWLFINLGIGIVFRFIGATALIWVRRRFAAYR